MPYAVNLCPLFSFCCFPQLSFVWFCPENLPIYTVHYIEIIIPQSALFCIIHSFIHSINIPGSDTCYTWPDHFQEKISENTGFFWMYSGASLPIQVIRQHLILKALCLMDWGRDINLKISVLQAVHITLMAGQQVRDENCELFSSV